MLDDTLPGDCYGDSSRSFTMASHYDADPVIFEEEMPRVFTRSRLFAGYESTIKAHELHDQRSIVALSEDGIEIDHGSSSIEPKVFGERSGIADIDGQPPPPTSSMARPSMRSIEGMIMLPASFVCAGRQASRLPRGSLPPRRTPRQAKRHRRGRCHRRSRPERHPAHRHRP